MADTEALVSKLSECAEKQDFESAIKLVRENKAELAKRLQTAGTMEALKKTTSDRLLLSFLDCIAQEGNPLDVALARLERILGFTQDSLVLSKAWGLGVVRRIDYFYRRVTVDFRTKKGHQFTYAAAMDTLKSAPKDHILVLQRADSAAFEALLKDAPGDFVKAVLKSYGDMTITRLEDVCVQNGFVKSVNWKSFWDRARVQLKSDTCVEIPAKRADPIRLRESGEDYGKNWVTAFSQLRDAKLILSAVREFVAQNKFAEANEETKAAIGDRLTFAVTAARNTDHALYAQIACEIAALGFTEPKAEDMRGYLMERKHYIKAAAALPAREVGKMISFLACDDAAKARLYKAIPDLCFAAVGEIVGQFGGETACREAVAAYMREPKAPATLTTLLAGSYEKFKDWTELPPLITLLTHAIALGEGRQSGETLRMQNIIRRLFGDKNWLTKIFNWLDSDNQILFFERFQASIAWDPSTHHTTVVRMTRIVPELESHVVKVEKKKEYARVTSYRSFGLRKQEYLKLINEDMPENVRKIEQARGYGDLSENAEYQYAKDEQRALMQKQALMQAELEEVKPDEFVDAMTDEVMPGVTVVLEAKDGEKIWTILGEWDNDLDKGIISSKTRVAQNLLGKKVGDSCELPSADGNVDFAKVKEIRPLTDDIREWMKLPAGVQI